MIRPIHPRKASSKPNGMFAQLRVMHLYNLLQAPAENSFVWLTLAMSHQQQIQRSDNRGVVDVDYRHADTRETDSHGRGINPPVSDDRHDLVLKSADQHALPYQWISCEPFFQEAKQLNGSSVQDLPKEKSMASPRRLGLVLGT